MCLLSGWGHVIRRDLSGLSLDGELPFDSSVWEPLNTLTSVNLSDNNLSGFLPPQISELTSATTLNLGGNSFSGGQRCWSASWVETLLASKLSAVQGPIHTLISVWCHLAGELPSEWSSLSNLQVCLQLQSTLLAMHSMLLSCSTYVQQA